MAGIALKCDLVSLMIFFRSAIRKKRKCPGAFYPGEFPMEKVSAKSVPGHTVNLPRTKLLTSEISTLNWPTPEINSRNYFRVETVPRQ